MYKQLNLSQGPAVALYYQYDANGAVANLSTSTAKGVTNVYSHDILELVNRQKMLEER